MASSEYLLKNVEVKVKTATNVVDLINKVKFEEKKEKRKKLYVATAAVSALAISGIIISL